MTICLHDRDSHVTICLYDRDSNVNICLIAHAVPEIRDISRNSEFLQNHPEMFPKNLNLIVTIENDAVLKEK